MVEPAFGTGLAGPPIPGSSSPPGVAIWKLGPRLGLGRGPSSCLHNDPYTLYIGLCEQRGSLVRTSPVVADGPERIGRLTGPAPTASATRRNCLARACSITHAHDRLRHPEGPYPSAPASPLRTGPAWPCTTYPLVRHPARARRRARRRARCRSPRPDRTGRSLNAPTGAWCSLTSKALPMAFRIMSQCTYRCVVLPDVTITTIKVPARPRLNAPTGAWCSLTRRSTSSTASRKSLNAPTGAWCSLTPALGSGGMTPLRGPGAPPAPGALLRTGQHRA